MKPIALALFLTIAACGSTLSAAQDATDGYTLQAAVQDGGQLYVNSHGLGAEAGVTAEVCVLDTHDIQAPRSKFCKVFTWAMAGGYRLVADPTVRLVWLPCPLAAERWPVKCAASLATSAVKSVRQGQELWRAEPTP